MFSYKFIQNAFLASLLISILCPAVGTFLVLKRHSMMGDALSHSSFAGIAIGLLLGFNPIVTSFIFTSLCALFIEYLRNYYKKYSEIILVIVMTLSVGIGITLVSMGKTNANINTYLFGSILTVSTKDLYIMCILGVISLLILYTLFNKLLYISFDEEGAQIAGINTKLVNYIFSLLVGSTISLSIRIMGILVISSMIALPTATALQLNCGFKKTFIYSIIFGFLDIVIGLFLSFYIDCAPGGTIAICSVVILLFTILFKKLK
ncbi:metal ABC transporter permease [Clostridium cochlearium]|uniref:High-affinity Zinc uptake system membrane protein znuB n=1 Tax=Clostridium cochlearium TaxID=1494 RepID=A0A240AV61_CLOCO|nr:metal ABC transporter permease [Clostridium cochlearium]NSJ91151.1 metal ABC transporter permease [Coprococcus sp. MSK.21.13]MBE6065845.1 metal ABC transporter permease [Clostridium cochlearium]MBU5268649.1 metal ABC transporter permease [Clostridium cochlearium]MCG4571650.1 metal ABC transporter permease [Clostridium cochlearium]MCG4580170.1 metal ABC transporter permease [Clostridium cochlearium]